MADSTSSGTLYVPLGRRPEATTISVKRLVERVLAGEVRLPPFQRPLRWRSQHVVELLDSIWRGYPIGSLLFWRRPAPSDSIRVGGATVAVSACDAWWLVDGQQRTTAMAATLGDLHHGADRRWSVYFDPERCAFFGGEVAPERVGLDIPLALLGDRRRLLKWMREYEPPDELTEVIETAEQRILDYTIPVFVVETSDEQALRAAFYRLNSTGVRMRADEVFQALLSSPTAAGQDGLDLEKLQRACDVDGFGEPPRAEVLKAVLAMSGLDPTARPEHLRDGDVSRLVEPEQAEEALSLAAEFLQRDCGIPKFVLIPYPVVFVILSRWFALFPGTDGPTRTMLARWVWRGAATGVHQRAEVSRMREQSRALKADAPDDSLTALLRSVGEQPPSRWILGRFDSRSAKARVETLALLSAGPRDRDGRVSLNALVEGGRVTREVFAPREVRTCCADQAIQAARTVANRVVLDNADTALHRDIRTWDEEEDAEALKSHLIDIEGFRALKAGDAETFLLARAERLQQVVEEFVDARCGWDEPVLRPTSSYFEDVR